MSERHTSISLPQCCSLAWPGNQTREFMLAQYRKQAAHNKAAAERILAAKDEDFVVEQHNGIVVKTKRKVLT